MNKKIIALLAALLLCAACVNPVTALAASGDKITIDGKYLKKAVVSENAIELVAEVRDAAKRIKFDEELVWTVVEGDDVAQITDGKITFKKAGNFTIRASEKTDSYIYANFSGTAYQATFSNVAINNSFEKITVNTQPIKLSGDVEVRGITPADECHYELKYEVVSGSAEIYLGEYLRITGKGEVVLKAESKYDSQASTTVKFNVTDPDEGKIVGSDVTFEQERIIGTQSGGSCGASVNVGGMLILSAVAFAACLAIFKRK